MGQALFAEYESVLARPELFLRSPISDRDDTHARMKALARQRAMSVNKLMEELCTIAATQHDAETRFRALSTRGSIDEGLRVLDKLDDALGGGE